MRKVAKEPVRNRRSRPNIVRKRSASWDELMKLTDPGPPKETEEFVRFIYDLRRRSTPRKA